MSLPAAEAPARHIAIIDGGSFVLPYVHGLVMALRRRGHRVTFYGSHTRYNAEFLEAMREAEGVDVVAADISGSVAPRWRGGLNYVRLLWRFWRRRREYDTVNLQFSVLWPLELPLWWLLRKRFVYTVHNAVPHDFAPLRHRPTAWTAGLARALIFPSRYTRDEFVRRYGQRFAERATVAPIGLLPLSPHIGATPYKTPRTPISLVYWSTVKRYKGVELFSELAACEALRERGMTLEVHGAWSGDLHPLKRELVSRGVRVEDAYLDADAQTALFARDVVFVLPYREASQSAALYTLLNHGCYVICADVGDLGDFMRRFGLQGLLLRERNADSVPECLDYLLAHRAEMQRAFAEAQRQSQWDVALQAAWPVYEAQA